jgi:glycosyltransferase involved in cell wall biosynthesis
MRVLTFTTLFPNRSYPNRGVFVRERTRHVAKLCDLRVVAPVPASLPLPGRAGKLAAVPREEQIAGLSVSHPRFLSLPGAWSRLKPRTIAKGAWTTVEQLHRAAPFDLIDAHFAHPDGAAAARLSDRLSIPFVLSVRGSDVHRDIERPALRSLILKTASAAARVIAVAAPLAERLIEAGVSPKKIRVIPNGVDATRFAPRDRRIARRTIGADSGQPLLLAVAALKPVKGLDVLLDSLASLPTSVRLWIVGEGPQRSALESRAVRLGLADRVRFVGAVPHEDLVDYYAAADGFVLPSRNEGCPNVLLEALASGCPAVASRVGHVPALLDEAWTVPAGEPATLAASLRRLLDTRPDAASIRRQVKDLTWEAVAARVLHVFQEALGKPVGERTSTCSAES